MEYDVLEESRHAVHNLEQNAWSNHREQYVATKAKCDEFSDQIDVQELKLKEAKSQEEIDGIQDELTRIIDDILSVNDGFSSSLITVDTDNPPVNLDDQFVIDMDKLLSNN